MSRGFAVGKISDARNRGRVCLFWTIENELFILKTIIATYRWSDHSFFFRCSSDRTASNYDVNFCQNANCTLCLRQIRNMKGNSQSFVHRTSVVWNCREDRPLSSSKNPHRFWARPSAQPFSAQCQLWKWVLFAWEWQIISTSKAEHLTSFSRKQWRIHSL